MPIIIINIIISSPCRNVQKINTALFKMTVGVLTTCHTKYTSDSSIFVFYLIEQHSQFL